MKTLFLFGKKWLGNPGISFGITSINEQKRDLNPQPDGENQFCRCRVLGVRICSISGEHVY